MEPGPIAVKVRVLTTGSPGSSLKDVIFFLREVLGLQQNREKLTEIAYISSTLTHA